MYTVPECTYICTKCIHVLRLLQGKMNLVLINKNFFEQASNASMHTLKNHFSPWKFLATIVHIHVDYTYMILNPIYMYIHTYAH